MGSTLSRWSRFRSDTRRLCESGFKPGLEIEPITADADRFLERVPYIFVLAFGVNLYRLAFE